MLKYLILGAVQGVFEWLPISSEGVVSLVSSFLNLGVNPVNLSLFLHLGTLVATLIYFRKEWLEVLSLENKPLLFFLLVSTPVSLGVGFFLYPLAVNAALGKWLLLVTGTGLLFTAFFNWKGVKVKVGERALALAAGFLQGLAVIPGVSRSGATLFGLSFGDFEGEKALRYSYMMSVPVILASNAYLFLKEPSFASGAFPALLSSFVVGTLTLKTLVSWSKKVDFYKIALLFSLFCFAGFFISVLGL